MKTQTKIIILICIIVLVAILFFVFFLGSVFGEIKKISNDFILNKQKISDLEFQINEVIGLKTKKEEIKSKLEGLDDSFIDANLPIDFIRFLEKISRDCNVETNIGLGIPSPAANNSLPYYSFNLSLSASFTQEIFRYMEKLKYSRYFIAFENINFSKGENFLNASLGIKALTKF